MLRTISLMVIALHVGMLSASVKSEVKTAEDACLYLVPIYVKNVNSSIVDDAVIGSKFIPENFTVVRTNLTFICEYIFTNNKEFVVGEVMNCTHGTLDEATSAESVTVSNTRITLTATRTKETVSRDEATSATTATSSTYNVNDYQTETNIRFKNISDICPKAESQIYWQKEASKWIDQIYLKIIGALGLPGNILVFVTILTMKPLTSSSLFISILATSDTCVLIEKIVFIELSKIQYNFGSFACGFFFWTVSGMGMYSHWLVVLMTIERFVAVWFPFRVNTLCTKQNASMLSVIAWVCLMGFNFHFMWTFRWNGTYCSDHPDHGAFLEAWYWLDGLFTSIIPAVFLFFCNVAIIIGMRRSQAILRNMNVKEDDMKEKMKAQQQVTIMLLAISITFTILTGPLAIFTIYQTFWDYNSNPYESAKHALANSMMYVLLDMNYAVNFYMYFLTGRKFRVQLTKMFGCYNPPKRSAHGTTLATSGAISSKRTDISMVATSGAIPSKTTDISMVSMT